VSPRTIWIHFRELCEIFYATKSTFIRLVIAKTLTSVHVRTTSIHMVKINLYTTAINRDKEKAELGKTRVGSGA